MDGTPVEFADHVLRTMTDLARVKKAYKLNSPAEGRDGGGKGKGKVESTAVLKGEEATLDDLKEIEVAVLGCMALRGAS